MAGKHFTAHIEFWNDKDNATADQISQAIAGIGIEDLRDVFVELTDVPTPTNPPAPPAPQDDPFPNSETGNVTTATRLPTDEPV